MLVFAVTTNVEFQKKPDWLDSFFAKHNKKKYEFHVTLIQPRFIQASQVETIKNLISESLKDKNSFSVSFDKLVAEASESEFLKSDACIMLEAEQNESVKEIQRVLVKAFSDYSDYVYLERKKYEEDFKPHITIADDLNREEFEAAKKDLGQDCLCEARVSEVILSLVYSADPKNTVASENIIFHLT